MPRIIGRLNEQLRGELANLICKEILLDNGLITVSRVDCSADLKYAKIFVSVLPEKYAGTALNLLRKHSGIFCGILRNRLKIRQIPKFNWILDTTESKAAEIEETIKKIGQKNG